MVAMNLKGHVVHRVHHPLCLEHVETLFGFKRIYKVWNWGSPRLGSNHHGKGMQQFILCIHFLELDLEVFWVRKPHRNDTVLTSHHSFQRNQRPQYSSATRPSSQTIQMHNKLIFLALFKLWLKFWHWLLEEQEELPWWVYSIVFPIQMETFLSRLWGVWWNIDVPKDPKSIESPRGIELEISTSRQDIQGQTICCDITTQHNSSTGSFTRNDQIILLYSGHNSVDSTYNST